MKKIDLHIHTVPSASDSHFEFSLDVFREYVTSHELDGVAVTNHNLFDHDQFLQIKNDLQATVFPGIEINVGSGHLLLISDGATLADFDAKCAKVSSRILTPKDFITPNELLQIFGDLSSYLIIPHYDKQPAIKGVDFDALKAYFSAGEVQNVKKFVRANRDDAKLCPALFSDSRMKEGAGEFPVRYTYIDCGELTISAIKSCFQDKSKVCLSKNDGNNLLPIFDNGQQISTGLNVLLGERSSGKTWTLDRLHRAFENAKYIKQFSLVQADEKADKKKFENDVTMRRNAFVEAYLSPLRNVIDDVSNVDLVSDSHEIEAYLKSLLTAAEEIDREDAFSKVGMFSAIPFPISDNDVLKEVIESVIQLVENLEYREIIEKHLEVRALKTLAIELIQKLWQKTDDDRNRGIANQIIRDVKDELRINTSATPVADIDLYELALNGVKVKRFNEIAQSLKRELVIFDETVQGFRVVASKGPFKLASEMQEAISGNPALSGTMSYYRDNPYAFLQALVDHDKVSEGEIHKLFVRIKYEVLNKEGAPVSGGERSEFRLLQEIKDAQNYDALLLDEPESSFDNGFLNNNVNQIVRAIAKEMPVVVVTHNNTVGASIQPNYILYARKTRNGTKSEYRLYSGYPTDNELMCIDGTTVDNHTVHLHSLEAGDDAYENRRRHYETIKDRK